MMATDTKRPGAKPGAARDSVTTSMDTYLRVGHAVAIDWCGADPRFTLAHVLGSALIHSAQLVADALDRNTKAIAAQKRAATSNTSAPTA